EHRGARGPGAATAEHHGERDAVRRDFTRREGHDARIVGARERERGRDLDHSPGSVRQRSHCRANVTRIPTLRSCNNRWERACPPTTKGMARTFGDHAIRAPSTALARHPLPRRTALYADRPRVRLAGRKAPRWRAMDARPLPA